ncbi:MAG: hypothetical protein AAF849_15070 [Bacteroidota bacterium]
MNEIQVLRYQLIAAIMDISDLGRLRSLYREAQPVPSVLPDPNIPVMEVKSGVSLEEIKAEQTVRHSSFEDHMQLAEEVEWDEPLTETLKLLD